MLLRHIADPGADTFLGPAAADVAAVEGEFALPRRQFADDGLHQSGLAGAVAPEHGYAAAPRDADADVEQDLAAAIAGVEMLDVQKFRHGADRSPGRMCWPGSRIRCLKPAPCPGRARSSGHRYRG